MNTQSILHQFDLVEKSLIRAKLPFETQMADHPEVMKVTLYELTKAYQQIENIINEIDPVKKVAREMSAEEDRDWQAFQDNLDSMNDQDMEAAAAAIRKKYSYKKPSKTEQAIQHGNNLLKIFTSATITDPIKLYKSMRRLEVNANLLAVDYCNGENGITAENWDEKCKPILYQVKKILNTTDNYPIFLNGDARGYSLKIEEKYVRETKMTIHTDWGGYGILAPDFD
jgi:hypothetical protein